jgi:hypothetical protein
MCSNLEKAEQTLDRMQRDCLFCYILYAMYLSSIEETGIQERGGGEPVESKVPGIGEQRHNEVMVSR